MAIDMTEYSERMRRKNAEQRIRGLAETLATALQSAAILSRILGETEEAGAIASPKGKLLRDGFIANAERFQELADELQAGVMKAMLAVARGDVVEIVDRPAKPEIQ